MPVVGCCLSAYEGKMVAHIQRVKTRDGFDVHLALHFQLFQQLDCGPRVDQSCI